MPPDYRAAMQKALRNQHAAAAENNQNKSLAREAARQLPSTILNVADVAAIFSDALDGQRREILEHVGRMLKLIELKQPKEDLRAKNFHERLCAIESELRTLKRLRSR